ncbi:hypothetical protein IAQ61_003534 [Plenodomus lingam]|uniref:uncharacterized protein n=1 Tax=Leptosphaeria maculans TaxID=5022 RepID=UPI0033187E38|nr:hypothetical protein IAQ61_003534 [Plenodomus lingam]
MPSKRKETEGSGRPPKKSRPALSADEKAEQVKVHWALPTTARGSDASSTSETITRYSQRLFGRPWSELRVQESAFRFPHVRTPVFQAKGKDIATGGKRELSKALCDFFNLIKASTFEPQEGDLYTREALEEAFSGENQGNAVVASGSHANAILALATEYQVEVTVRPDGEEESAHLILLRKSPHADSDTGTAADDFGYFIQLPHGMRVTVNGLTYVNEPTLQGENSDEESVKPFIIGPLERFAIIELLAQPIFFFRAPEDLDFKDAKSIETESRTKPSELERQRRSTHGNVPVDHVEIAWTLLGPLSTEPDSARLGNGDEAVYSDEWTDDEPSPCSYLQRYSLDSQRDRLQTLVPRVLAAINARQPEAAGFSVYHDNRVNRPGRTWLHIMGHAGNSNHFVLLIVQVQEDRRITLQVMDPLTWRSTRQARDDLFNDVRRVLSETQWWKKAYESQEEMRKNLPAELSWSPSVQHPEAIESLTLVVLSAWTLALGLSPDPNFRLDNESFFSRAHAVFQMVLNDTMNWKVLVSFLRCIGFVRSSKQGQGDTGRGPSLEYRHIDPSRSHRFDLSKHSFERLMEVQTLADAVEERLATVPVPVRVETGVAHTRDFPSDHLPEEHLVKLKELIRRPGGWNLTETWPQLKQRLSLETEPNSPRPTSGSDNPATSKNDANTLADILPGSAPRDPQIDTSELESEFDACQYFRSEMSRLVAEHHNQEFTTWPELSSEEQTYASITAVARSINEIRPISKGFSIYSQQPQCFITSGIKNAESPTDQFILRYVSLGEHFILIVIRNSGQYDGQPAVYAVDPAPWLSTVQRRQAVHRYVEALSPGGALMPESIRWIFGSGRGAVQHSGCITVLNAWAILLDLPLSLTDFAPDASFYDDAHQLMHVVQRGRASWKLIWAFLRCRGYLSSDEPPAPDRRFMRTSPDSLVSKHEERMNQRPGPSLDLTKQALLYRHFDAQSGYSHRDELPWDMDDTDIKTRIPTLLDYNPQLTRNEVRRRYAHPCADFRRRMNERLEDPKIASDLRDFRDRCKPTQAFDAWLDDTEVSLSIGAVTLGITRYQQKQSSNVIGGFAYLMPSQVQLCEKVDKVETESNVLRAARPLIVPLHYGNHFILLVIQLDDQARVTFAILNSMNHHLDSRSRQNIHKWARTIVIRHGWMGAPMLRNPTLELPVFTTYIPVSQQPTQSECGYYVIINAWILALGLQPDSSVRVDWSDEFFEDLINLIHLTRIGKADWALIYAFLRCRRLALRGEVPIDRRFDTSYELRTEGHQYLGQFLEEQDEDEQLQFFADYDSTTPALSIENIKATNRCNLPAGMPHTQPGAFPWDNWSQDTRVKASELIRKEISYKNLSTESDIEKAHKASKNYRGQQVRRQLQKRNINPQEANARVLLHVTREYMRNWHAGHTLQHEARACATSRDILQFYHSILRPDALGTKLKSGCIPDFQAKPPRANMLYSDAVNIAIAAVVEAIDRTQSEQHANVNTTVPFTGGFTLATTTQMQLAMGGQPIGRVSRPWRCFLVPLTVSGHLLEEVNQWRQTKGLRVQSGPGGHHILAVVERHSEEDMTVNVYYYDSSPERLRDAYPFLTSKLKEAMSVLGWLSPRNIGREGGVEAMGSTVDYRFLQQSVTVPKQPNGWMCGAHTIINAWILALGLTPAPQISYPTPVYEELHTLAGAACSGLLTWMVLVNWLRCRKLITQKRLGDVAPNRRFEFTNVWRSEMDLKERILEITETEDQPLLGYTETQLPYDFSNNLRPTIRVSSTAPAAVQQLRDILRKFSGLNREYDDDDDMDWKYADENARNMKEEMGSDDALHFLSEFEGDADDTDMSNTLEVRSVVVRSKPDKLMFLDGYS